MDRQQRRGRIMLGRAKSGYMRVRYLLMLAVVIPMFGFAAASGTASAQGTTFTLGSVVATNKATVLRDQPSATGAKVMDLPVNAQAMVMGGPFNDGWYWLDVA